jgi:hypothetical protein
VPLCHPVANATRFQIRDNVKVSNAWTLSGASIG